MDEIFSKLPEYLRMGAEVLGSIAVLATVLVRLTPNPKDDSKVNKIVGILFKVVSYLPTIGINPKTKKLEEAVKEFNKK